MGITLGPNQYGKAETRVVHIRRDGDRHEIRDLNVSVALSGDMEAVGQALDAGADGFLRKPLSVQDLLEALEALRRE